MVVRDAALAQRWFGVTEPEPGVHTIEEPLHRERVKSYLIVGMERALLLDTGMGVGDIRAVVRELTALPIVVVNSHAHWDHVGGNWQFAPESEILIHRAEAAALRGGVANDRLRRAFAPEHLTGPLPPGFDALTFAIPGTSPTRELDGGETIDLGGRSLTVIHAPGHSSGGIVLYDEANAALFSTDVAYPDALYCFAEDGDLDAYRRSMSRLAELARSLRAVYPAHGESPMAPSLLPRMRDALDEIASGRAPDEVVDGIARYGDDGFAVLVARGRVGR